MLLGKQYVVEICMIIMATSQSHDEKSVTIHIHPLLVFSFNSVDLDLHSSHW